MRREITTALPPIKYAANKNTSKTNAHETMPWPVLPPASNHWRREGLRMSTLASDKRMCQYPGNSSQGLKEWENNTVSAKMEDSGNSEYSGFVNPVLELSDFVVKQSDTDQ